MTLLCRNLATSLLRSGLRFSLRPRVQLSLPAQPDDFTFTFTMIEDAKPFWARAVKAPLFPNSAEIPTKITELIKTCGPGL